MLKRNISLKIFLFSFWIILPSFLNSKSMVYFSPEDNISSKLVNLINQTMTKIHAAVFVITDKKIAQALIEAKKRGVDVQIITDRSCLDHESGKVDILKEGDIDVFVFKDRSHKQNNNRTVSKFRNDALMHDKFALIDNNLWTGSFNWTVSADKKNKENVIITDEAEVYKKYDAEFEKLKQTCNRSYVCVGGKKDKKYKEIEKSYYHTLKTKVAYVLKRVRDTVCD